MMFESTFCKESYRQLERYLGRTQKDTIPVSELKKGIKIRFDLHDRETPSSHRLHSSTPAKIYKHVRLTKEIALQ
jgi:hypothetical protein